MLNYRIAYLNLMRYFWDGWGGTTPKTTKIFQTSKPEIKHGRHNH